MQLGSDVLKDKQLFDQANWEGWTIAALCNTK